MRIHVLVHHLFNKNDSLVGTKSLVHFFRREWAKDTKKAMLDLVFL